METGIAIFDPIVSPSYHAELRGEISYNRVASSQKSFYIKSGSPFELDNCNDDNTTTTPPENEGIIVLIPIEGMIRRQDIMNKESDRISYYGMYSVSRMINACIENANVKAIVFDVESGGGFTNANSDVIDSIVRFKATGRKTYAAVDTACSAAYHLVSFCDFIVAKSKMSILGCVGTMWEYRDYVGKDVKKLEFYSDLSPLKNQEFIQAQANKPELLKQNLLNPMAQAMIDDIIGNREITKEATQGVSSSAEKGLEIGLCDAIMSMGELLKQIASGGSIKLPKKQSKANSNPKNTVMSDKKYSFFGWTMQKANGTPTTPEQDQQAAVEIERLMQVESQFVQVKAEKESLQAQIQVFGNMKVELENAQREIVELKAKLQTTPGAAAQQPVSGNQTQANEAIMDDGTQVQTPISKDIYAQFDAEVKNKSELLKSNFNFI